MNKIIINDEVTKFKPNYIQNYLYTCKFEKVVGI